MTSVQVSNMVWVRFLPELPVEGYFLTSTPPHPTPPHPVCHYKPITRTDLCMVVAPYLLLSCCLNESISCAFSASTAIVLSHCLCYPIPHPLPHPVCHYKTLRAIQGLTFAWWSRRICYWAVALTSRSLVLSQQAAPSSCHTACVTPSPTPSPTLCVTTKPCVLYKDWPLHGGRAISVIELLS